MSAREERIGRNEALFRDINERLGEVNQALGTITHTIEIVCECGTLDCLEHLRLSLEEYEGLRADATTFAVRVGHEIPDVEEVVTRSEEYVVVRKHPGDPAEIAQREDPRS
jgi:hypothetical protein